MRFTLGADPEWFLTDGTKPVSAIGKFGGTKKKPLKIKGLMDGYALQEDNVTIEYNIPPAKSHDEWLAAHRNIQEIIKERAAELNLRPLIVGSVEMPKEELEHPMAWVFGCEPDFNVWELKMNPPPSSKNMALRSAGGHIHVGFNGTKLQKIEFTKLLDLTVGVYLAARDPDKNRKELYGKAGTIRFKKYGIEYRTPSNWWTATEQQIGRIWALVEHAFNLYQDNFSIPEKEERDLLDAINNNNLEKARHFERKYGLIFA